MMNLLTNKILSVAVIIGVWSAAALMFPESGSAKQIGFRRVPQAALAGGQDEMAEMGAVLKTDPELEDVLAKAQRMRNDGQYRVACTLWQAVLNRSGDALFSSDGEIYYSLVEQVEAILAELPPEGLVAYRVIADAAAKEILAEAADDSNVTALNSVVRNYFISSLGDESAFNLGSVYLDQFDFIGARRMFEKIATQYPDPTVPMDEVYSKIALCQAFLGDMPAAKEAIAQALAVNRNSDQAVMVSRSLGKLTTSDERDEVNLDWKMALGNAHRYGVMQSVPDEMMEGDLEASWQFYFEPKDRYNRSADIEGKLLTGPFASGKSVGETLDLSEKRLIESWRNKSWRPAGELLIDGDRLFFKTGSDLSVWSRERVADLAKSDGLQATVDAAIAWRSVWKNAFQVDDATMMMSTIRRNWGGRGVGPSNGPANGALKFPVTPTEINLFGDRVFQQMSICKDIAYSIEGKSFDDSNPHKQPKVAPQWNATFRRTRENFLTAYDAKSGQVLWRLPREESDEEVAPFNNEAEESEWLDSGGFMAAPVGFGELVIVPVNNGGAISIYALDPKRGGKTVWQSFLCDEPETGSVPWAAIELSLEGSDLFVSCGMGVVFVLDPATGTVRFAKRYQRVGQADNFGRRSGWTVNRLNFDGWSSDIVIPYGKQMVCFSSDTDSIEAIDRNTGELIWRTEMSPVGFKVDYILGVYEDVLYAGGFETVVAYDLKGQGRMIWGTEQMFDGRQSLGRGMVTPNGIYLPVEDRIYQLSLKGKNGRAEVLKQVHVDLGTNAPVGNLYSDGERFWVHGANRLYMLDAKRVD
jgi:outer membrane protein assembly factor BamB/tetratricopeptide (TPR) repeat protein